MSTNIFTPQLLLATKEKNKDSPLFKLEGDVRSGGKTEKGKKDIQSYYIPFKCKNVAGKYVPLQLKFIKQITASGAKLPYRTTEDKAKHMLITFKKLTEDDLSNSDYSEAKREDLLKNNTEFVEALNIIADEYLDLVKREVFPEFKKGKKAKFTSLGSKKVHCFRQTSREVNDDEETQNDEDKKEEDGDKENDNDDDGKKRIPLEHPMYRIKLKADNTQKIGYSYNDKYFPTVFDMKKTAKESAEKGKSIKVVAKVISKGVARDLTIKNVRHFITYLSLSGGIITFESICISSQGISLLCHFKELFIWRHKPLKQESMNTNEISDMAGYGIEGEEDVNIDDEEEKENSQKPSKGKNNKKNSKAMKDLEFENDEDAEEFGTTQEPEENDDEDVIDPDDIKVEKKPDKKSTKKNKEPEEIDGEEPEDNQESEETKDQPKKDSEEADLLDESDVNETDDTTEKKATKVATKKSAPKKSSANLKAGDRKKQK